jgi:hypothetical protein
MSRTLKDSKDSMRRSVIEVIKRPDGTFDLFRDRKLEREGIHEEWMVDVLCVRFGYCAEEYDAMLHELNQNGRVEFSLIDPAFPS